jgi:phage shock protein A
VNRPPTDEALTCLSELANSSGELYRRVSQLNQWMSAATQQAPELSYARMMPLEKRLVMMEQISEAIRALARDGNRFRRMEARALYAEGLTMAQLAAVFGVSRQRVSTLLRGTRDGAAAAGLEAALPAGNGQRPAGP